MLWSCGSQPFQGLHGSILLSGRETDGQGHQVVRQTRTCPGADKESELVTLGMCRNKDGSSIVPSKGASQSGCYSRQKVWTERMDAAGAILAPGHNEPLFISRCSCF